MRTIRRTVVVAAPLEQTFDTFCWFEGFPESMKSFERVRRDDEQHDTLHWLMSVASVMRESTVRVAVDSDAHEVEWHSEAGLQHRGTASFQSEGDGHTRLTVRIEFTPRGLLEHMGDKTRVVGLRVGADLRRFAKYVASEGTRAPAGRRVPESHIDDRPRSYAEKLAETIHDPPRLRRKKGQQEG